MTGKNGFHSSARWNKYKDFGQVLVGRTKGMCNELLGRKDTFAVPVFFGDTIYQ